MNNKLQTALSHLEKYRSSIEWEEFFKNVDRLIDLYGDINDELHEESPNLKPLDKEASILIAELEKDEDKWKNKTETEIEFNAVVDVIYLFKEDFNNSKSGD